MVACMKTSGAGVTRSCCDLLLALGRALFGFVPALTLVVCSFDAGRLFFGALGGAGLGGGGGW